MKRFLLILDLNGTLIYRSKRGGGSVGTAYLQPSFNVSQRKVFLRPNLQKFFESIPSNFDIAIWTSAERHTSMEIIARIVPNYEKRLVFWWFRDKCVTDPVNFKFCRKDLSIVWDAYPQYNEYNTILVDDSLDKAEWQPKNLFCIREFTPFYSAASQDSELLKLSSWMNDVSSSASSDGEHFDVRDVITSSADFEQNSI
ncbi:hypothetical protein MP638_006365 [Amoeboaphelidium occidentale]|nr:hypothetical protein MP638_006365 [Amoeboaphelidium occidentale]